MDLTGIDEAGRTALCACVEETFKLADDIA